MKSKTYKVIFARCNTGNDGPKFITLIRALFRQHGGNLPDIQLQTERYQVRDLEPVGRVWKGVFAKLRDDAPHVRTANNAEHEIKLGVGDHILEKCHFLYRETDNILVWQTNRVAGGLSRAEEYFSEIASNMVWLPVIMNDADLQRVLNGKVRTLEFAYARPAELHSSSPKWDRNTFDTMASVDAAYAKFELRAPKYGHFNSSIKTMIQQLIGSTDTKKVRVKITDESDPIDLFMAPLKETVTVGLHGRYPKPAEVYEALESAYDRQRENIPPAS